MLPIKGFSWTMRSVLFAIVLGMFVLAAPVLLAQANSGKLAIQLTNVINEPIVDYEKIVVPVATAAGGTFTVPVICLCGPAFVLRVEDCGTNSLRIESSTNLVNWAPFPQPGFHLTLGTNSSAIIPAVGPVRFFRAVRDR